MDDRPADLVLQEILAEQGLVFRLVEKQIVIRKDRKVHTTQGGESEVKPAEVFTISGYVKDRESDEVLRNNFV